MEYRVLTGLDVEDFKRIAIGHFCDAVYIASKAETEDQVVLMLTLEPLVPPCFKSQVFDDVWLMEYARFAEQGYSMGVYNDDHRLIGIALAEKRERSKTLWVWELHVDKEYNRQGIGRTLMDEMAHLASNNGFDRLAIRIQNTNVAAVKFCRAIGLAIEAVDLSSLTNSQSADGDVMIYMKRKLP
ncbi:MAG: GCN5-related N-acetyltransferase [Bacillota bacterium]|nr:MAG: GCN5-related N-acetyltransferase [Bacillota bacterium]MBS3949301.1 GNAT family N-acetyltransferase [Peptococcaceae bacterium]